MLCIMHKALLQAAQEPALIGRGHLRARIELLDALEEALFLTPEASALRQAIDRLEAINQALFDDLRDAIMRGDGAAAWQPWSSPATDTSPGYDYRDALVSGVLRLPEPQGEIAALAPGMVFYQPTPARRIFDLLALCPLRADDVLVDLGAGLGHVSMLTAACSAAASIGIEHEAAYVESARAAAQALRLERARFVVGDLNELALGGGTVFYLYTPVTGSLLQALIERLRQEASQRPIRVASLGPCTAVLADAPGFHPLCIEGEHRVALFVVGGDPALPFTR
ncbi:hypothetical protein [Dyella sp.]|uniref:hypothetical protein n=1 Tax=Dyella sp. TaxID=1869338 RepID=UPI002ED16083